MIAPPRIDMQVRPVQLRGGHVCRGCYHRSVVSPPSVDFNVRPMMAPPCIDIMSVCVCVAVCWSVLQCVAVCSSVQVFSTPCQRVYEYVLQCVAVCCSVLQRANGIIIAVAVCCSVLQYADGRDKN